MLKLTLPILILGTSLISLAIQQKWHDWDDRRTKKHRLILRALVMLMVVATLGTCWVVWQDTSESSRLQVTVDGLKEGNDHLLTKNDQLQKMLDTRTEQIIQLGAVTAQLSSHISGSITGGNSFCYYLVGFPTGTSDKLMRLLLHAGKYPLHDLYIRIVDGDQLTKAMKEYGSVAAGSMVDKGETRIHKETFFGPGQDGEGFDEQWITLPHDTDYQTYNTFFTARNGSWRQQISLRRVDGKWRLATRVMTDDGKLLIPEKVPDEFPRDPDGAVRW